MQKITHFIFFSILCVHSSFGQLNAEFSSIVKSGCSPLIIQFYDSSFGNPDKWDWSFGNGKASTDKNPLVVYDKPGVYTVSLTIKKGNLNSSVQKKDFITVYSNPIINNINFSSSYICSPFQENFSSTVTAGSGEIKKLKWSFGDGDSSFSPNPSHTYNKIDTFDVTLSAINTYGCNTVLSKPSAIICSANVDAAFNYVYTNVCNTPSNIQFNNTSASKDTMSYQWFFGDGQASLTKNPAHSYMFPGIYAIKLIAKSFQYCSDTIIKTISVAIPHANFILPKNPCLNSLLLFQDSSSPQPLNLSWNFGDGSKANGLSVYHSYSNPGIYVITMTADFGSCSNSSQKTITISAKPSASFTTAGMLESCTLPQTIDFTNASVGAASYTWDFGDGVTSNESNTSHVYDSAGSYTVKLIATNAEGCSDTSGQLNLVQLQPVVITGIGNTPFTGCAPKTVNFQPFVITQDAIISYYWNFGDGTTASNPSVIHQYNEAGGYTISLQVKTETGCTDTFTLGNAVALGVKPKVNFTVDPLDACASNPINFTDKSAGAVTNWIWDFGDGIASTDQNTTHQYLDTGYFAVKLVASSNGCADSLTKINAVHINPPIADFRFKVHCEDNFLVDFANRSIGGKNFLWDFGDNATSSDRNSSHKYSTPGVFKVTLTAFNSNGCSYTKDTTVHIFENNTTLSYTSNQSYFCKYDSVLLQLNNFSTTEYNYLNWDFGDSITTGPLYNNKDSISHEYLRAGNFTPIIIVRDIYYCFDTITSNKSINVFGPTASFVNTQAACTDSLVVFDDFSQPYKNYPITLWNWDYGDSSSETLANPPFQHVYSNPGIYTAKLKITDSKGCYDTAYSLIPIQVSTSLLDAGRDTSICSGDTLMLMPSGAESYTWQFSNNLSCTDCATPAAYPQTAQTFFVKGTNAEGCTSNDSIQVMVKQPFTMKVSTADTLCAGSSDTLTASGTDEYKWKASDQSTTLNGSPVIVSPPTPVTYTVIGTDELGCFSDTASVFVPVFPIPNISFADSVVVLPLGSRYLLQPSVSNDVIMLQWTPLTFLSCTNCADPVAAPPKTITYTLTGTNEAGCAGSANITLQTVCKNNQIFLPNTFSPNNDGMNDIFYPRGINLYTIRSLRIFNRLGQMVFEGHNFTPNDATRGWNGYFNGRLQPTGVYVFRMEVICDNNELIPVNGNVTLLR